MNIETPSNPFASDGENFTVKLAQSNTSGRTRGLAFTLDRELNLLYPPEVHPCQ